MRNTAPATSTPAVIPMISYEDGIAALEWLRRAFGFRETARLTTPEGKLSHGEMEAGNGLIMLASPTPEDRSPKRHRESCGQARKTWKAIAGSSLRPTTSDPRRRRFASRVGA